MSDNRQQDWKYATQDGMRRAMIRASLKMTVRQRLEMLEEMNNSSRKLAALKKR